MREKHWSQALGYWQRLKPQARQMRRAPTEAEAALWSALRNRRLGGYYFRRQHPIGRFLVDFYCPQVDLAIEVDGASHTGREQEDKVRDAFLNSAGVRVLRFTNEKILLHMNAVLSQIEEALKESSI